MSQDARILVATDDVPNAHLLAQMLRKEFPNITVSTDPDHAVADFDRSRPNVLILAFNGLEKAERYYLGLFRQSALIHTLKHRAIILCNKDNLVQVYDLCRKGYFDDYILFWPLTYDSRRLFMAVNNALQNLDSARTEPPIMTEMPPHERQIALLDAVLENSLTLSRAHAATLGPSMERTKTKTGAASDGLSDGEPAYTYELSGAPGSQHENNKLDEGRVQHPSRAPDDAVRPISEWLDGHRQNAASYPDSAHTAEATHDRTRPLILIVDDDAFQRKILARVLAGKNIELVFAASGDKALAAVHKRKPDLILMDIELPDFDGIEVTRRLKAMKQFSDIPVIMITGQSEKTVVADSIQAGAADFVIKPFNAKNLRKKLSKFVPCLSTQNRA